MSRKTILVPVDFGSASLRAVDLARELGGPLEAEVVLLHVVHRPHLPYPDMPSQITTRLYDEAVAEAKRSLDELAARTGFRAILREGEPRQAILDAIAELAPALVVMGTHGRKGVERLVLGSVAQHVVRRSEAPVLVTRAAA